MTSRVILRYTRFFGVNDDNLFTRVVRVGFLAHSENVYQWLIAIASECMVSVSSGQSIFGSLDPLKVRPLLRSGLGHAFNN